jgi:regulator of sirC expression with transglutaminase-like and TPR domain
MVKDCYLLTSRCYIRMGEQTESAMVCLKQILDVEPNDPEALLLRGQANHSRAETVTLAFKDYLRVLELCRDLGDRSKAHRL